jgi:hypothetical protein
VTTSYPRESLSIDQQLALRTAATNLQRQFDGVFGAETFERFLHSSYDEFTGRAVVPNFRPLLAERFALQRLTALARVEGNHHDGVPIHRFLDWPVDDPAGLDVPAVRPIRDDIERRVRDLLDDMHVPAHA